MLRPTSTLAGLSRLWLALLLMPLLWALPSTAVHAAQFKGDDLYELPAGQTISEDLFVAGRSLVISGIVDGDLFAAGQTIRIDGVVTGHVFAAGEIVLLTGEVQGDLYAAGETVIVEGTVAEDLRVAGGGNEMSVEIADMFQNEEFTLDPVMRFRMTDSGKGVVVSPDARIGGDTLAAGMDISLAGQFGSDVHAAGANVFLIDTASVSGDFRGEAGSDLAVGGRIAGDSVIKSPQF
ncbi:MAG: polymer-forming cytoskeletal protein [Caldilineaceae bacterium SB0666_bin_21]|nr:polymer-forming cytoskeletal protein [Caldilineaceae bacterium SB0666_bin_21]